MYIFNGRDMYVVNFSGNCGDQKDALSIWNAWDHILETTVVKNHGIIEC